MKQTLLITIPILLFSLLLLFSGCKQQESARTPSSAESPPSVEQTSSSEEITRSSARLLNYPETRRDDTVDLYFDAEVPDPYRWLEDDLSDETADWVEAQNHVTFDYLEQIPFRDRIREQLEEDWNYERLSSPSQYGDYVYFSRNDGLQNHSVIYRTLVTEDGENNADNSGNTSSNPDDAEIFLDPNTFSDDGTTSLAGLSFTKDGSLATYAISEGGSDWRKFIVLDTRTMEQIGDTLVDIKFSGISWYKNEGFYYSSYQTPEGSQLSARTDQHRLFFHRVGTPQSDDHLVFGEDMRRRYVSGGVTDDQRFLIVSARETTSNNELYIKDLEDENSVLAPIIDDFGHSHSIVDADGDRLLIYTNLDAPNYRLVEAGINRPEPEHWVDVIPETEHVLNVSTGGGYLFANYLVDVQTEIHQFDYNGNLIREVELPGIGTAGGFSAEREDTTLYYSFTSFTYPSTIFQYDIDSGESGLYWMPNIDFDPEQYVTEQVFYESRDGTEVPMFVTYKKGLERDGSNPTYMFGYGGFNVSLRPSFSVARLIWLENGGIYAQPNIRGGGEYGQSWHHSGIRKNKQNVFDDFIAAGEYLIDHDYTSSERLAIAGGSNGGLLVGAVMTQRPDLAAVAFPAVGVLDMLRYHTFTAGAGWAYDYGTANESEEMFRYLLGYSPLHNIEDGTTYPSTLITTGDHDDRVVPAHSYKFAAELQNGHNGDNPVLLRVETRAGHGAGRTTASRISEWADRYAFAWFSMGLNPFE